MLHQHKRRELRTGDSSLGGDNERTLDMDDYEQLIALLKARNVVAFLQQPGQLVVAVEFPNFPSRNSFWVTFFEGAWHLVTWSPHAYRIPPEVDVCEVCTDVLRGSATAIYRVDEANVLKHRLQPLTDDQAEELFGQVGG